MNELASLAALAQSDNAVRIYATLALLVDYDLLGTGQTDPDASVALALSERFDHSWLVVNGIDKVAATTFHSDYHRFAASVANCFVSVVCLDPAFYCPRPEDLEPFLASLLRINLVHKRKLLVVVPPSLDQRTFALLGDATERPSLDKLCNVVVLSDATLDGLTAAVGDLLAGP